MKYLVLAVILAACSGDSAPTSVVVTPGEDASRPADSARGQGAGSRVGSRLKPVYQEAEDGTRLLLPQWYDPSFDAVCVFTLAEDGRTRCVPWASGNERVVQALFGSLYLDDTCASEVFWTSAQPGCSRSPAIVLQQQPVECGTGFRVIRAGAEVTVQVGAQLYQRDAADPAKCVATVAAGEYIYVRPGAVVSPSEFVAGEVVVGD